MESIESLACSWLNHAEVLDRYRDERGAELCRMHAQELEEALRSHRRETLTLSEASEESGYSTDHLRHLVSDGTIPNAGRKGAPRIERKHLPMKPGAAPTEVDGTEAEAEADEILRSMGEVA